MSLPFERLLARVDATIAKVEAGEPIDYEQDAKLAALDMAAAGVHYTVDAIGRTTSEDDRLIEELAE